MSPARMSRIEAATRIALEFHQALNRHDVEGMMRYVHDECVFEHSFPAPDGMRVTGKESAAAYWLGFFQNTRQAQMDIEEIVGLGLRCFIRWKFFWIDREGRGGSIRGVDLFKISAGLIEEKLSYVKGQEFKRG